MSKQIELKSGDIMSLFSGKKKLTDFCPKPVPRPYKTLINDDGDQENKPNESKDFTAAASLLYNTFRSVIPFIYVNTVHGRLRSALAEVKNEDKIHKKGTRTVHTGIQTSKGKQYLNQFEFQHKRGLKKLLGKSYDMDTCSGVFSILNLIPKGDVHANIIADRAGFTLYRVNVDFENKEIEIKASEELMLNLYNHEAVDVNIEVKDKSEIEGIEIYMLQILFYDVVNGVRYLRQTGNTATIVGVA